MRLRFALLFLLVPIAVASFASEAAWFKWKNKIDKTVLCSQLSPGTVWEVFQGPFMESHCKKTGNPQ